MKKKSKAAFLANLKAMPDCEEKDKLLKSLDEEPDEDDDDGDDDAAVEKSITTDGLSKALDELERIHGETPAPVVPLGARLDGTDDVGLAKSMDATGFVKSLVEQVTAHSDDVGAAIGEVSQQQAVNNTAVLATGKLVLSLAKSIEAREQALNERFDRLLAAVNAPAQPRTTTATPMAKSFNAGGGGNGAPQGLSKAQLANVMNEEMRKSIDAGDTARVHQIQQSVIRLTSSGAKDATAQQFEQSYLRQAKA